MKNFTKALLLGTMLFGTSAIASLTPFQTFNGNVAISSDGFGSTLNAGIISAQVPAGATVLAAYLYTSTYEFGNTNTVPTVTLNGVNSAFGPRVANTTACCNLASARADVTALVKGVIDGGAGGIYNFDIAETNFGNNTDGEALVVIYELASLPVATVGILDGFASVTGDTASINFANPLDPSDPGFFAEMSLGIGFSCCDQKSTVHVNGNLLTDNAGNNDDGSSVANGSLITVGGFDDDLLNTNTYEGDDERYNLAGFVSNGDTSISVRTSNPSQDDNIFLASFYVSGEATITNDVPEPSILMLFGLGLVGMGLVRRRKATS